MVNNKTLETMLRTPKMNTSAILISLVQNNFPKSLENCRMNIGQRLKVVSTMKTMILSLFHGYVLA